MRALHKHSVKQRSVSNAGRPDKAIDYLYASANHATPTHVWREEQSLAQTQHGQIVGDMPHNWASVEFIRLVRHLLVFERGDVLELLPALPPEWLTADRPLRPDRCVLHIPQAAKTNISQVLINGQPTTVAGDGTVELPITKHITVKSRFC